MKPLSAWRKIAVSVLFLMSVGLYGYGLISDNLFLVRLGKYGLLGFVVFFGLLILPYWRKSPEPGW